MLRTTVVTSILLAALTCPVMSQDKALVLKPKASTSPGETHAAMVVSKQEFEDVRFSGDFTTMRQLLEVLLDAEKRELTLPA
jgi:hypothetical protein